MTSTALDRTAEYTTTQARIDLAAAHRLAVIQDLKDLGLGNHFTLLDPENPARMIATPVHQSWPLVTASSLQLIESEEQAAADRALWINYRIHWPIHQARPDAACVLHLHPTYLTVVSMIDTTLNDAEQTTLFLRDKIAYSDEYDRVVGGLGMEMGHYLADQLGDKTALVMRNHGVCVVGPTVAYAYGILAALEQAAKCHIIALSTGKPFLDLTTEKLDQLPNQSTGDHWETNFTALKQLLDQREPDYKN